MNNRAATVLNTALYWLVLHVFCIPCLKTNTVQATLSGCNHTRYDSRALTKPVYWPVHKNAPVQCYTNFFLIPVQDLVQCYAIYGRH